MTTEEFIARAKEIHGDKYDYSKVEYVNNHTKVCVICPQHGDFLVTPKDHLRGNGCNKCGIENRGISQRCTTDDFVSKAKKIHGDKYDYSKVNYIDSRTKVCIICPKHGEFWQSPTTHLRGAGCSFCAGNIKMTTKEFISKAKKLYCNKYDYSKTNVDGVDKKVCIICPEHGEFWQSPRVHLRGRGGCPKCSKNKKITTEEFITRAKEVHGDKYNYSKVVYTNSEKKVCVICPEHGEFWQNPLSHLSGCGCPKCNGNAKITTDDFVTRAKEIHGNKYDYSKVEYINSKTPVCIICPQHGEFWQEPSNHLSGQGCPKCSGRENLTTEEFIARAKEIHSDKYDYSKVEYVNNCTKICIICPQHGKFYQVPSSHLQGHGCPICNKGYTKQYKFNLLEEFENEYAFRAFLENNDINILLSILINIEPKYEPIKKDIERALAHASETNPIQSLREKYSSDAEESDDDDYLDDTNTTDTDDFDWDNDDEVNDMISQESEVETDTDTDNELSIDDIIRNDEEEIRVINRLDSEHLITPEVREYIKAKYKNDMMRAWMAKRDNK